MEDAREVTQARIVVESGVIELLLEHPQLIDRGAMRRHLAAEGAAVRANNAVRVTRLTTDYHLLIAGFLRNAWISRQIEELVLRSLVFVSLYGHATGPKACGPEEHRQIGRWLLAGSLTKARAAMIDHLRGLELFLDFRTERKLTVPLAQVFRPISRARP
jgi:DNA-binding GntR family transcriptional regulator